MNFLRTRQLVAAYGAVCTFVHLSSLGFVADRARELSSEFASNKEAPLFLLFSKSSITASTGLISGTVAAFACFFLIYHASGRLNGYKTGILVLLSYLGAFAVPSLVVNPSIFRSIIDCSYALVFSVICGAAIVLSRSGRRRKGEAGTHRLELEHARIEETLQLLVLVSIAGFASIFVVWGYQFFFHMPPEIAYSESFHWLIFPQFLLMVLVLAGLWAGIMMQLLSQMSRIEKAVLD